MSASRYSLRIPIHRSILGSSPSNAKSQHQQRPPGEQIHLDQQNSAWKQSWQSTRVDEPTSDDSCVDVIIGADCGHQHIPLGSRRFSRDSSHFALFCFCFFLCSVLWIPGSQKSPAPRLRFSRRRTEPRNTHTFSFLPGRWRSNHTSPDGD